jgi:hypothetical protein
MLRKPSKSKGEFSPQVKQAILARSGGRCEAQTPICRGEAVHFHHRRLRSQGGKGTVENGLHVCIPCHTYVHDHPERAYAVGWMVHGRDS